MGLGDRPVAQRARPATVQSNKGVHPGSGGLPGGSPGWVVSRLRLTVSMSLTALTAWVCSSARQASIVFVRMPASARAWAVAEREITLHKRPAPVRTGSLYHWAAALNSDQAKTLRAGTCTSTPCNGHMPSALAATATALPLQQVAHAAVATHPGTPQPPPQTLGARARPFPAHPAVQPGHAAPAPLPRPDRSSRHSKSPRP